MEPVNRLKSNVHQLTNDHTQRHTGTFRHEGRAYSEEAHGTVPSLIQQLRDSMSSSSSDGSGGGSQVKQLPINAGAIQLYDRISDTAAAKYVALSRVSPRREVEDNIRGWMSWCLNGDRLTDDAVRVTTGWVSEILNLLAPKRTFEIVGKCPACGYAKHWHEVDGEMRLSSTLAAIGTTVTCQYAECGESWTGDQLLWLGDALRAGDPVVA